MKVGFFYVSVLFRALFGLQAEMNKVGNGVRLAPLERFLVEISGWDFTQKMFCLRKILTSSRP